MRGYVLRTPALRRTMPTRIPPRHARAIALLFAILVTRPVGAQAPAAPPAGFDAYVARVIKTFDVPGVAVAIVKDGRVVLAKGYGVRTVGKPDQIGRASCRERV